MHDEIMEQEMSFIKRCFDLDEIMEFQLYHTIEVMIGRDYQYHCYIDKGCYSQDITPLSALVSGIIQYKKYHNLD